MHPSALYLLALSLTPSAVSATIVEYDFQGHVASGIDGEGLFGAIDRDLTGLPYRLRIAVDFNRGGAVGSSGFPYSHGGDDAQSPLSVQLSVGGNGFSLFDFGMTTSYFAASDPLPAVDFGQGGSSFAFSLFSFNHDGYSNRLIYQRPPGGSGLSYFTATLGGPNQSFVDFGPTVVPRVQAVPEPTGWAMMVSGFAIAGTALRRRQGRRPAPWAS